MEAPGDSASYGGVDQGSATPAQRLPLAGLAADTALDKSCLDSLELRPLVHSPPQAHSSTSTSAPLPSSPILPLLPAVTDAGDARMENEEEVSSETDGLVSEQTQGLSHAASAESKERDLGEFLPNPPVQAHPSPDPADPVTPGQGQGQGQHKPSVRVIIP